MIVYVLGFAVVALVAFTFASSIAKDKRGRGE